MRPERVSRRSFIGTAGAAGAGLLIIPRRLLGGPGHTPPSMELTRAVIGVGNMGKGHLNYAGARTVAVCDVDEHRLAEAVSLSGVKGYRDFREILALPEVDVVHISTPDHWHGPISMAAALAGKDVWCEKPMTRTIGEGIRVRDTVRATGRMFRINTWFRFGAAFYGCGIDVKALKKLVDSGMLGWPLKVTVGGATGFNWKSNWSGIPGLPAEKIPAHLDYEMWLGPAPWKPYNGARSHAKWRGYWDYGGGGLADMGQHYLDPVQYVLGKDNTSPVEIEADGPPQHPDACLPWRYVVLRYADGCEVHLDGHDRYPTAPYIEGPEGKVFKGFRSTIPDLQHKLSALPDPLPQADDFYQCVRERRKFALNETNGFRSATMFNLANIGLRLGRKLRFDPDKLRFIDDEEANRLIWEPARARWNYMG